MKRIPKKDIDSCFKRQKFEEIEFESGRDSFDDFFALSCKKPVKSLYSFAPFQEISIESRSALYTASFHDKLSSIQPSGELNILSNYLDFLILNSSPAINPIPDICIHLLNHLYKYKTLINLNSSNLSQKDQAFTPAVVMVIVPSQLHARTFIETLVKLHCKDNWKKLGKFSRKKFKEIFEENEENNNSDAIKLGITLGDKDLSLFTSFKKSDIILGTPLSLKQGITKDEDSFNSGILCSIQIVAIIDTHLLLMQNWDHVEELFKQMNLIPDRDSVSVDLNRIRDEYLDGNSKNYRQLVLHTEILTPIIMSLFNRNPNNRGKAKTIEHYFASIVPVVQKFRKFEVSELSNADNKRFEYFAQVWKNIQEELLEKSVLFVKDYFEYVRIKNFLEENDPGVHCLSEYTPKPERQRALSLWNAKNCKALCITERLLFFRPLRLNNIGNLVFYSLPDFNKFYTQLVSNCKESLAVFCKYDGFTLQRILGDSKAEKIISSNSEIFSVS